MRTVDEFIGPKAEELSQKRREISSASVLIPINPNNNSASGETPDGTLPEEGPARKRCGYVTDVFTMVNEDSNGPSEPSMIQQGH